MITVQGTFTLCDEVCLAYTSTDAAQLTLSVTTPHPKDPNGPQYKLVWVGQKAAEFFAAHEAVLKIGAALDVQGRDPRVVVDRGTPCILLDVVDMHIKRRFFAGAPEHIQTTPPSQTPPRSRWIALQGVLA